MATTTVSASSQPNPEDAPDLGSTFLATSSPHLTGQRPRRGRPPVAEPRPKVTIRLPQKTLEALRQSGRGWQTRLAQLAGEMVAADRAASAEAAAVTERSDGEHPAT